MRSSDNGPSAATATESRFETDVPARLDRLPWSRFHWRVVLALGVAWVLNGLEVTLVGSLASAIQDPRSLDLSNTQMGWIGSAYVACAGLGALGFGWLADHVGRQRLFFVTLLVYMAGTIATGFAWDFWSLALFRAMIGAGIGGEYAAVNSAIQELVPAQLRGRTDLYVNGTFWGGAAMGAVISLLVLNPETSLQEGWRVAFVAGGLLCLVVLCLRRYLPESPRWLMLRGRPEEAERIVSAIERDIIRVRGPLPTPSSNKLLLYRRGGASLREVWDTMRGTHRDRAKLGFVLMSCQAFFYNAFFFTYAMVLTKFYGVQAHSVGWYMLAFALGNLSGPFFLGRFFDTVGRKPMIVMTYGLTGLLTIWTSIAFAYEWFSVLEQTAAWAVIFFFASAAASAAYLTVGESFPLEMRATAIALFYAIGMALGAGGPALYGWLIGGESRSGIMLGYLAAGGLMLVAAATEWLLGFDAEGRPLEEVAKPLAAVVQGFDPVPAMPNGGALPRTAVARQGQWPGSVTQVDGPRRPASPSWQNIGRGETSASIPKGPTLDELNNKPDDLLRRNDLRVDRPNVEPSFAELDQRIDAMLLSSSETEVRVAVLLGDPLPPIADPPGKPGLAELDRQLDAILRRSSETEARVAALVQRLG
ncbi:MFS transporter [Dankookia rubra]|uniref:MFS transporter n=1 Tax=Dankookia rubra TaxID=1442381 RepID=UPI0018788332|nr:MFS transporter [Dankookia rubra]